MGNTSNEGTPLGSLKKAAAQTFGGLPDCTLLHLMSGKTRRGGTIKPFLEWRMTAIIGHLAESAIAKRFSFSWSLRAPCTRFLDQVKHVKVDVADSTYEEIHYATQTHGSCEEHHWRRTLAVLLKRSKLTNSRDCKRQHTSCPVRAPTEQGTKK